VKEKQRAAQAQDMYEEKLVSLDEWEEKMRTAELARENKFQSKLLEESLKLHALNE
jgi:hypothetical protein